MNTLHFHVDNLKCGGCSSIVRHRLLELPGVTNVVVDRDAGTVHVDHDGNTLQDEVRDILMRSGYQELGKGGLAEKAKSYISCAIGRMKSE